MRMRHKVLLDTHATRRLFDVHIPTAIDLPVNAYRWAWQMRWHGRLW